MTWIFFNLFSMSNTTELKVNIVNYNIYSLFLRMKVSIKIKLKLN